MDKANQVADLIEQADWYERLVEDCKNIVTEGMFAHRWALIECYHTLGKRLLEEHDNFERAKIYGKEIVQRVAISLGCSKRTLFYAIQFASKFPSLNDLPEGKNVSWRKVVAEYLPAVKEPPEAIALPAGTYGTIVIDPPWPMEIIEREVRPNQTDMPYDRMSVEEISSIDIPSAPDCHLWLWTTQRFLPESFAVLDRWGFRYVCAFVWHKPGGFQPVGLPQYNCEFALYARHGSPTFADTRNLPLCFSAARGAHSEKPAEFYDMVQRVTVGRRLDMFNRRAIDGFEGWGNEAPA